MRLTFLFTLLFSLVLSQNDEISKLEKKIAASTSDTARSLLQCRLCNKYRKAANPGKSLESGNKGLALAKKNAFDYGIAYCNYAIGITLKRTGDFKEAIPRFSEAEKTFLKMITNADTIRYPAVTSDYRSTLNQLGIVYKSISNYPRALDYYFSGLTTCEKAGDIEGMASAYNNIAEIYNILGDRYSAYQYQKKDVILQEKYGDKSSIANAYANMAILYFEMHDTAAARLGMKGNERLINCYKENQKALKLREEIKDSFGIALSYGNIGMLYPDLNEEVCAVLGINYAERLPMALDAEMRSKEIMEKRADKFGVATAMINIANLYSSMNEVAKALKFAEEAQLVAEAIGDVETECGAHRTLYTIFKNKGQVANALLHYEKYILLRDSIYKEENKQEILRKQLNYDFKQKEFALKAEQEKEKAILDTEKKQQKYIIVFVTTGLALVLSVSMFLFKSLQTNRQKNKIILHQKRLVDEKQKELIDSITYAKRIQSSLLPHDKYIARMFDKLKKNSE